MSLSQKFCAMQSPIEAILSKLRNKAILVLGFGREGKSTLAFFAAMATRKQGADC